MRISRTNRFLTGGAALALVAGVPAIGQDTPESLLPPGFGDPAPAPAPRRPTPAPVATTAPRPVTTSGAPPLAVPGPLPTPTGTSTPGMVLPPDPAEMMKYEIPAYARRSLNRVGAIDVADGGVAPGAFGTSDGVFIEMLMRRTDAPVASRWLSIALRRMLVSELDTPRRVNGADFAAERAWLLIRMGEADMARAVVQSVDIEHYTPKLYQVAMQAMLASADPAGMCPLVPGGKATSRDAAWVVAEAMCAGLSGDATNAGKLIDAARRRGLGQRIDVQLGEKILGSGAQGRRAVTIEWDGVTDLTAWRYGLAVATGVEIPDALLAPVGPRVQYWRALAPRIDPRLRVAAAEAAAAQGVLSGLALVDLYSQVAASDDTNSAEAAVAGDLATAYTAGEISQRLDTMRQLWNEPKSRDGRYARLVLTARAAARIVPDSAHADDADDLIASILTAGLDHVASQWEGSVRRGSAGWAMIQLSAPGARPMASTSDVDAFDAGASLHRKQLYFAGLAGLGRLPVDDTESLARRLDVRIGESNRWTTAIASAGQRGEAATVLVLAALAMQTNDWRGVHPVALYHIVAALRAVGMEGEARMIAAEAIARS